MVAVGVDLHKRVSQIAVLTADGELTQHRLENEPKKVEQFFTELSLPARAAIEASATWWWLVDLLAACRTGQSMSTLRCEVSFLGCEGPFVPAGVARRTCN